MLLNFPNLLRLTSVTFTQCYHDDDDDNDDDEQSQTNKQWHACYRLGSKTSLFYTLYDKDKLYFFTDPPRQKFAGNAAVEREISISSRVRLKK